MKSAPLDCILLILFFFPCCGQVDSIKKETEERDRIFGSLIPAKAIGWTSDFDNVFTKQEIIYLDSIIGKHEEQTSNEVAVVTLQLDSTSIKSSKDFDEFSLALFRKWGVGKKEKNNGIGILFSRNLRKVRIEVGYGLESKLTNQEAKNIIDTIIVPEFKKSNYFGGIANALKEIIKEIE